MSEIKPQAVDIIYEKLAKLRCKTGCLNTINYLVFGHGMISFYEGLYCSSCLSTISDLTPDHFVNLNDLSKLLEQAITQYEHRTRGETSQLNLIRAETEASKKEVKKFKDTLSFDLKTVKDKSFASLDELFLQCFKENQNQPLEAFYEPDITATLILTSQAQLLLKNLNNLHTTENGDKTISYTLKETHKNPQIINKKVEDQYHELDYYLQCSLTQCRQIMEEFKVDINEG